MTSSPASWPITPLGELVDVLDFARIPVSANERSKRLGSVPYYGAAGQVGWINERIFDEQLVLLGEDGVQFFDSAKTKAYAISGPAWVNNHAHVLRARPAIDGRYLLHFLNQFDYHGFANGTTRLKLTQAAMRRIPICHPDLVEQRRIVNILDDHLSRLNAGGRGLRETVERIRLFQVSSLVRNVRSSGRSTCQELMFGDTALQIGPGWEPSRVAQAAQLVEYGTSEKTHEGQLPGDIPVLRMGNVKDGRLTWGSLKYLASDHPSIQKLTLLPGDLLFNRTNSAEHVGKSAVFEGERPMATFASYLIRVRFGPEVNPRWANMVINSPYGRAYIASVTSQQVGQANVNGTKLKGFPLPIPPLDEQAARVRRYADTVDHAKRLISEIQLAERRLQSLRRSILAAAFSGQLTGRTGDMEMAEEMAGV